VHGKPDGRLTVVRYIVLSVYVTTDDALYLHKHVVESGRHCPCASAVADATAPAHLDRVWSWVRQQRGQDGVSRPRIRSRDR
jgi:hypothetical protein